MKVNFFWTGDDFQYLNRLSIISHILVGHEPVLWLYGNVPNSKYWIGDIPEVEIKDASVIAHTRNSFEVTPKKLGSKRLRIISDMWEFAYLYEYGGLYCDTDVIALKHFPVQDWIITRDSEDHEECYAIGIIKAPPKHPVLKYCVENWHASWFNTRVYTAAIKKYDLDLTHPKEAFHPFTCGQHSTYLKKFGRTILLKEGEIPDAYSIHYFSNKAHKLNVDQEMVNKYPNSVLYKLSKWVFKDYSYEN